MDKNVSTQPLTPLRTRRWCAASTVDVEYSASEATQCRAVENCTWTVTPAPEPWPTMACPGKNHFRLASPLVEMDAQMIPCAWHQISVSQQFTSAILPAKMEVPVSYRVCAIAPSVTRVFCVSNIDVPFLMSFLSRLPLALTLNWQGCQSNATSVAKWRTDYPTKPSSATTASGTLNWRKLPLLRSTSTVTEWGVPVLAGNFKKRRRWCHIHHGYLIFICLYAMILLYFTPFCLRITRSLLNSVRKFGRKLNVCNVS